MGIIIDTQDIAEIVELNSDELNAEDLGEAREAINELIVTDFLLALGYNRKKDKTVKRVLDSEIDWKISNECTILVVVQSLNSESDTDINTLYKNEKFDIAIVFKCNYITVYRYCAEKEQAIPCVTDIDITKSLDSSVLEILDAISKQGFNIDYIDDLVKEVELESSELKKVLYNHTDDLAKLVNTDYNTNVYKAETIEKSLDKLITEGSEQKTVETDNNELQALNEEINLIKNENESLKSKIESYESHKQELEEAYAGLENEKISLNEELGVVKDKIASLNELETENKKLKESVEEQGRIVKEQSSIIGKQSSTIEEQNSTIEEQNSTIEEQNSTIEELKTKLSESNGTGDSSEAEKLKEQSIKYQDKIRELTMQLSESNEVKESITAELKQLKEQVDELSGSELKRAEELLNVIEDDKESNRAYVAVINAELLQFDEIHRFIGRCLQKLYDIKGFDMQRYIFDGEIYSLERDNVKYNDLLMGSKYYDIGLKSNSEIEELNKLRILFSYFSDVVFLCKTVGKDTRIIPAREGISEEIEEVEIETDSYLDENGGELEETNQFQDDAFDSGFESNTDSEYDEQFTEGFDNIEKDEGMKNSLLACLLAEIDKLIWTDEQVVFNNIKYVGSNNVSYGINVEKNQYDMLLCKCIDAAFAVAAYEGDSTLIQRLKSKDFSMVNSFLKLYTEEYRGYPRINGTRYAIVGVESVQQVASILGDVCTDMQIPVNNVFIYFDADTNSEYVMEYAYPEDGVQLSETINYVPDENTEENIGIAIIKGDFSNHMVVTKNSLRAHSDILVKPLAIKTRYISKSIAYDSDISEIIASIIHEALNKGFEVNYRAIGNLIGTNKKLLSENIDDVGENPYEIELPEGNIYCARMEPWQITHSLIKIHTSLFNDTSIAIKNNINISALEFYDNDFATAEPSLSLAVKSFTTYAKSCVRQ